MWKVLSQGIHMCNMKALSLLVRKLWPRLKFFKSRSNFKVKVTRSKIMVPCERIVTRNTHVQYESPSLLVRKLWPSLKFLFMHPTRTRTPGLYDISSPDIRPGSLKIMVFKKGLVTHMCNTKVLSLLVWKLWPRLKFLSMQPTPTLRAMT